MLESFPCFIVTDNLFKELIKNKLTGKIFDKVFVTTSDKFRDLNPQTLSLPNFHWLKVNGKAGVDDFGLSVDHELVISEKVWSVLQRFKIERADFEEFIQSK